MKNIVIMAAGMGTRLRPYTDNCPKPLVKVAGKPIIEHTLDTLKSAGLLDKYPVTIVTGYLGHQFEYLKDKYGANIVNNEFYNVYGNGYSLKCAIDYLDDALIIEGDLLIRENFIYENALHSHYYIIQRENNTNEWVLKTDSNGWVIGYEFPTEPDDRFTHASLWYAHGKESRYLKRLLMSMTEEDFKSISIIDSLFIDNALREDLALDTIKIPMYSCMEIDNENDMKKAEEMIIYAK